MPLLIDVIQNQQQRQFVLGLLIPDHVDPNILGNILGEHAQGITFQGVADSLYGAAHNLQNNFQGVNPIKSAVNAEIGGMLIGALGHGLCETKSLTEAASIMCIRNPTAIAQTICLQYNHVDSISQTGKIAKTVVSTTVNNEFVGLGMDKCIELHKMNVDKSSVSAMEGYLNGYQLASEGRDLRKQVADLKNSLSGQGVPDVVRDVASPLTHGETIAQDLQVLTQVRKSTQLNDVSNNVLKAKPLPPVGNRSLTPSLFKNSKSTKSPKDFLNDVINKRGGGQFNVSDENCTLIIDKNELSNQNIQFYQLIQQFQLKKALFIFVTSTLIYLVFRKSKFLKRFIKKVRKVCKQLFNKFKTIKSSRVFNNFVFKTVYRFYYFGTCLNRYKYV